ncbi:hypothetical protein Rhopal_007323-T1 [Rhodotorula paludigena]|uniref:Nitronate monooxygenase domain-containing protein n=1 Tax=Rhodotorula paludigena TaxID=86838 RepID=A0AAV5GYI8_9BASI|nr:hypothetical protein Rhopal_007323-T1 [Rhodotorula paludigena]
MAAVAGGRLAGEVHKAGGIGLVAAGHVPFENLQKEITLSKQVLGLEERDDLPLGVGLMCWRLESPHLPTDLAATEPERWLRYVIHSARARHLWLGFSATGDYKSWIERARAVEAEQVEGEQRKEKLRILLILQREQEVKEALQYEGLDAIVLQGLEAGGHVATEDRGHRLADFISRFSSHLPSVKPPFLLAAGGLSSARSVADVLSQGVAAVVPGTALCVADEALLPPKQKELLIRTGDGMTVKGMQWDRARGSVGWPEGIDGHGIRNITHEELVEAGKEADAKERYARAVKEGDLDRIVTWAGAGVADVKRTAPVREIMQDLLSETERTT